MRLVQRIGDGFDLIGLPETQTSLVRNNERVRLSWVNGEGQLEQLEKLSGASCSIGSLLISKGDCLQPTGDNQSSRSVAKLLANPDQALREKTVTINGIVYTAKLLPVQLL